MPIDSQQTRKYLKEFDFRNLFYEELGWDQYSNSLQISVNSQTFPLTAIAEKRGMAAFLCVPMDDGRIPDYSTRRKIENGVARSVHEHIIIYTDSGRTTQIWQWVRRETGRPTACREHAYHKDQPGESLIQKLQGIAFSLEEEENLTLVDVAGRTRAAFDLDRVTKRFYDRFKKEHDAFLKFIEGIPDEELLRWYASVMLNRLMFIYFIQKKGFLSDDPDYLRHKLAEGRAQGADRFYRQLLCPLFFEGFAKKEEERSPEIIRMLGKVPYLNGGIFLKHQIEESYGEEVSIPDTAFETLFDFFDQYQWYLDERTLRADNEINPDVLGYIFEKYINQKQMGAYYTKEDITEYIGKNTIIPFLFDRAREKCKIAFEGAVSVWKLLQADPDRYIYEAVKKGSDLPLSEEIAVGLNDVAKRTEWNKSALDEFALPTEIWREVVARRKRYEEVKGKALGGEITSINDFITYNLNIRQFAQDAIENCEGPELLRAFWHAIVGKIPEKSNERFENGITVLDPTCGSGAFLFAALNILEPLYEACLDRMEVFLEELERSDEKHRADKYGDFKKILKRIDDHPNRRYFILKSIIINNLFGVDIMEEAVEICKLRLFLKLVAQVEEAEKIEPLPDIDFNIRAGNTLVGFAKLEDVRATLEGQLFSGDILKRIDDHAQEIESFFELFRQMQTAHGMDSKDFADTKQEVKKLLGTLDEELNRYLAEQYGIDVKKEKAYRSWLYSHKPFHWFTEFHSIVEHGGFDIIIGNPPYVDLREVSTYKMLNLKTVVTRNLYPLVLERSTQIASRAGREGFIVPVSSVATEGYSGLQEILAKNSLHFSSFDDRPSHLFDGLDKNTLSILLISHGNDQRNRVSSRLCRWNSNERENLFHLLRYHPMPSCPLNGCFPKISTVMEANIWRKIFGQDKPLCTFQVPGSKYVVYYSRKVNAFLQVLDFVPEVFDGEGNIRPPSEFKTLHFGSKAIASSVFCCLNSSLFRWFMDVVSDGSHVNRREVDNFAFDPVRASTALNEVSGLARCLSEQLALTSKRRNMRYKHDTLTVQCIIPKYSKPIIDEIDRVLAKHYGLTDEELDFIINYDIKYRMGLTGDQDEGE